MRGVWLLLGALALAFGAAGIFLSLLPTVPFVLLSAFAFSRSSERLHHWLLAHPAFGPPISDWRDRGAIGRRAKLLASGSIVVAFLVSAALGLKPWVLWIQALVLLAVSIFIWTRPNA